MADRIKYCCTFVDAKHSIMTVSYPYTHISQRDNPLYDFPYNVVLCKGGSSPASSFRLHSKNNLSTYPATGNVCANRVKPSSDLPCQLATAMSKE